MKKTSVIASLALALILSTQSTYTHGQTKKRDFRISAFQNFQSMPANAKAAEKSRATAKRLFPGWTVGCDKLSGTVTDAYGTPIDVAGNSNFEKAMNCLRGPLKNLGLNPSEWVKTSDFEAPRASYVYFKQVANGHEIVFSKIGFRFTQDGQLRRVQLTNYGTPTAGLQPTTTAADAARSAVADIADMTISSSRTETAWAWFPVPKSTGYELRPAWHVFANGNVPGSVPLKLSVWVDAISGEVLYRTNLVKETSYDLTVKGTVYKNGMLNPTSLEPLPDLAIYNGATTIYTDAAGLATDGTASLPQSSIIPLLGKWSTVIDSATGLNPSFTNTVTASGTVYTYPTSAPSSDRHVNAYYHVNRIHNFMKSYFPVFTGMDFSLPTQVDEVGGTCNAFYDGTSINFYAEDAVCHSFATFGDVIYHEYGHGISDHMYTDISGTTITNGALNEANSDIWALSITRNPIMAADAFIANGGFIRRYDMTPQVYPIDLNTSLLADVHQNGQIIAGTWWDVGQNIGHIDTMTRLFADVYFDVPDGPDGTEGVVYQTILVDALMADDNDNNLANGTPHYAAIVSAFARHGIYLEGDVSITHTELGNQPRDTDIVVTASLTMTTPMPFHDLSLAYRVNDAGAWQMTAMTQSGTHFTGVIPGQPRGTVVSYMFIVHDSLNVPNAYFPITCNTDNPAWQSSIPYQFGVGLVSTFSNNFDGAIAGWGISGNAGDDATAGLWAQVTPAASPLTFLNITAWPGADHTSGTGMVLQTGNSTPSLTNFYGQGVASGTSTVVTPVFDLSGYLNPVVSYYRWFSNDQNTNFKNDPWIVKIGDTAGNWQTVERTYQSDVNWRRRVFQVHSYLPTANKISLKFFASDSLLANWDNNGQSLTLGALDDFYLYDIDTTNMAVSNVAPRPAGIFPNPADQTVSIVLPDNNWNGTLAVYDMTGAMLNKTSLMPGNSRYSIDLSRYANGSYLLVLQNGKFVQTKTLQVMHNR